MAFPINIPFKIPALSGDTEHSILLFGGLTTFVGPNGSGKTQVLRCLKDELQQHVGERKVRYLSGGRLFHLENFRSDFDGRRGIIPFDDANFGGKRMRDHRHKAETAIGDFHTLSMRPDLQLKVAERLKRFFNRDMIIDWDAGNLKILFSRLDGNGHTYSMASEASGLLNLVVVLAALYDDEVGALLLDEPELSLHPQLQSFILNEIRGVSGDPENSSKKLILVATHSTAFIDIGAAEDLSRIIFFQDSPFSVLQIPPDVEELKNRKIQSLLARLGEEQKAAFFSARTLLVEGPSDAIICNSFNRKLDLNLEAAGTQIISVIGKDVMPVVSKLMKLIGKTPIVLADLDGIADGPDLINIFSLDENANKAAQEQGHQGLGDFARNVYSKFCETVDNHWSDISEIAKKHSYWIKRDTSKDPKNARRRASMATILTTNEDDISHWSNAEKWLTLRRTLIALLDFLEKAGCFILRAGTIEDYYRFNGPTLTWDKVAAAVAEADWLMEQDNQFIIDDYDDILRALRFASGLIQIDELSALKTLLLSVVAPILNDLSEDTSDTELNSIAFNILRDRASLFKLSKAHIEGTGELALSVDIESNVLDIEGFPILFPKSSNPILHLETVLNYSLEDTTAS